MVQQHQQELQKQLWNIANTLRGNMSADDFRDYILGLIFYKYLSDKLNRYCDELLAEDGITFVGAADDKELLKDLREECVENLGYFIAPKQLFSSLAGRGKKQEFIIDELDRTLADIEQSTTAADSADDFNGLFEELDLNSSKLGKNPDARNKLISQVLVHLDNIDFHLENTEIDLLGDAYEYLIGQFASGAGKKAGEFYTPQQVSKILAKLVSLDGNVKSVYDPTCGSGSLLLRVAREVGSHNLEFCGQEQNPSTYNLARMNMLMHGVRYDKFDIKNDDTLEHPMHLDKRFDAVVANPPFSANWSANELHLNSERFADYGKLAPKTKADFAFVLHMIHQLNETGTLAVVVPHGILFRGAAEGHIRKHLIEKKNYLDAVIGLPAGIFFGTGIPTCILVFKKNRKNDDNVLFIDASSHFEKGKAQNYLRDEDVERIIGAYSKRQSVDKFAHVAKLTEIEENDYNLNIPRYVDTFEEEEPVDLNVVSDALAVLHEATEFVDSKIKLFTEELGIPFPKGGSLPLLRQYKKGVMQQLFNGKWEEQDGQLTFIPPTLRFKADDGSEFPDWEEKKLSVLTTKISDGIHSTPTYDDEGDYFFVNGNNLKEGNIVIDQNTKRVSDSEALKHHRPLSEHSILMSINGTIGNMATYAEQPIMLGKSACYINVNPRLANKMFIYSYLQLSATQFYFTKELTGSTIKNLSLKAVKETVVKTPCLGEQKKIANFLSAIDQKIDLANSELDKTKEWKKGLLQQMFV
ncbi:TPA: type I restriction-modification system subunit M [Vibrio vulnificus]|nr:type I restriction-modification system subunit M [Vibrio vulnificus]HAT8506373.1 type I restriction-modification system subunit M [Vibrio vulnificus]HDY7585073.1 type I restriction-modification system subunit M [Vibrio vulnificus]